MAKKHKKHGPLILSESDLEAHTDKAVREGRYQHALELAKRLYKDEPSEAHKGLLQQVYLGRARQLRQRGQLREACTVLDNALRLGGTNPAWLSQLVEELAACGNAGRALDLLGQVPDPTLRSRVLANAVDTALQQGPAGRATLPEDLQAPFDLILRAFTELEAGQDEAARATVQEIGLQSPFLEWKLLLRGLQAYHLNDDERAIENWQRLNPERLPARLAAPLRFRIDAAYRQSQPPPTQVSMQVKADQLQSSPLVPPLRILQATLARDDLYQAFRQAESLLPDLRREAPQLVGRLASCFYWAIVHGGQPQDIDRYRRVFGVPPDDPAFARLRALVMEQMGEMQEAHDHWQEFERSVAGNPAAWPGEQAKRVRALVWWHMGNNAASVPDMDKLPDLPPFLRNHPERPRPLAPSAEKCFEQSLKLAPDQLETYEALFRYHLRGKHEGKVIKAALQLLERFPDHVPTLQALGDLYLERQEYTEALQRYQRALKVNPLDRKLRNCVSTAHLFNARSFAETGRFAEARAEYQASLAYDEVGDRSSAWCKWAACEFKAGDNARAEELLHKALDRAGSRLAVAFNMVIEIIRLKLPRSLKSRFDKDFKAALAEPPTAEAAVALSATASAHKEAGVKYHGQKTHEKKVLAYLDKARGVEYTEEQLEQVCSSLLGLEATRQLRAYLAEGRRRFPHDPFFPYLEAESYLSQGPDRCPFYKVQPLLEKAGQLVQALPREHRHRALQEAIEHRQQVAGILGGPVGMFEGMFEQIFGGAGDDFDDEFDDDYDDDDGW